MIIRFAFHIAYDDGREFDVTTNARDQFEFEKHHGGSILDLLPASLLKQIGIARGGKVPDTLTANDAKVETHRFGWLAWHALHRTGQEPGDFDAFSDQLVGLDITDLQQAVPTRPALHSAS